MNFQSKEIQNSINEIANKVDGDFDVQKILEVSKTPPLSQFAENAKKLLPENLTKIDIDGTLKIPSMTDLTNTLNDGLNGIKENLENEINGKIEAIKGEANSIINQGQEVFNQITGAADTLIKNASNITNQAINAFNNAKKLDLNAKNLGALYNSATTTIDGFLKLSPKKLKELSTNGEYLNELKESVLDSTLKKTGLSAKLNSAQGMIHDQLDNSAYSSLHSSSILSKAKNILPKEKNQKKEDFKIVTQVERLVYWGKGEGATPEASNQKSNSGAKLISDYSLAVDNLTVLIGCKVTFSDDKKERLGVDIVSPSKGLNKSSNSPVVAIYFDTKEQAIAYTKKHPNKIVSATVNFPIANGQKATDVKKNYINGLKKEIERVDKEIAEKQKKLTGI